MSRKAICGFGLDCGGGIGLITTGGDTLDVPGSGGGTGSLTNGSDRPFRLGVASGPVGAAVGAVCATWGGFCAVLAAEGTGGAGWEAVRWGGLLTVVGAW